MNSERFCLLIVKGLAGIGDFESLLLDENHVNGSEEGEGGSPRTSVL